MPSWSLALWWNRAPAVTGPSPVPFPRCHAPPHARGRCSGRASVSRLRLPRGCVRPGRAAAGPMAAAGAAALLPRRRGAADSSRRR